MAFPQPPRPTGPSRMSVIRCGVSREGALKIQQVTRSCSVVVRSSAYTVLGTICILISVTLAVVLAGMLRCDGSTCRPPGEAAAVMGLVSVLPGIVGWYYLLCSSLRVKVWGLEVTNPVNVARIAWAELTDAYVDANGMSLRLRTPDFTVGVHPIQVSSWEGWFRSRTSRAQVWAEQLNVLRDRLRASTECVDSAGPSSTRSFHIRILPFMLAVAPWAIAVLLFSPQFGGR